MSESVIADSTGKIFGKLRSRLEETKPQATPAPAPSGATVADRIHPDAKYGDKPGEKRIDVSGMTKPLPSYKHGTDYVPKTGPAVLHEGEKVTPAKDNVSTVMDKITGGVPAKVISHMVHHKNHDGTHTIEHHHTHSHAHPVEHHKLADMDAVIGHMQDHAGTPNPGEAEADAGQSGIPPAMPAGAPAGGAPAVGA